MGKFNYFTYKEKRVEKFSPDEQAGLVFDLINAFALMKTPADSALLLQDLLTEKEIRNLAKRLRIAKLLLQGKAYEEIVSSLHCSYATVTKVGIWLNNAGEGFKMVIQRLPKRRGKYVPKKLPGVGYGLPQILLYFASDYLNSKEKKRLEKFLGDMRAKSATDKDFREEVDSSFASTFASTKKNLSPLPK